MKWLAFLFALYLLALSGIPCSADDGCCMGEKDISANAHCEKENDTGHNYPAPCSPFFACGACHAVTLPATAIMEVPYPVMASVLHLAYYTPQQLPQFTAVIWQPPRCLYNYTIL
ncbi:hypothetical protein [Filimonas lacunae]|uniref:hypothetical protein n=1 Tax=Filimonas lacunae TaxID=477680 RepID=UPI0007D71667|nr:hypothetical protein [Filimonas lacunae]BAV07562.1 hypothetical protein FLA_3588 [Filimonas lacunae]